MPGDLPGIACISSGRVASVHAHGFELVAPGIGDRGFAVSVSMIGVPSAACSANSCRPGAISGACGNILHVLRADRLHIGDACRRRGARAPRRNGWSCVASFGSVGSWPSTPFYCLTPLSRPMVPRSSWLVMETFLHDALGFRTREIDRQQSVLQIRAQEPPSPPPARRCAGTGGPRCRDEDIAGSCPPACRPRMTSWFSSIDTSS